MRHVLLLAAAVAAAAALEPGYVLDGCGCGNAVQTFGTVSAAYCPTTSYPTCDLSQMVEGGCMISCPNPRSKLVFRNATAVWQTTKSISCSEGLLTNTAGAKITNLMRPTCALMNSCDDCTIATELSCPEGYSCQESNLHQYTDTDGCGRLACNAGTLKLYENGVMMNYTMINQKLYCTVLARWSNYSLEGSITGGSLLNNTFTANCILPSTCENCANPNVATNLSQLPTTFRTGYILANASHVKEAGVCSRLTCPDGYTLYGFNGNATNVTGLEYTNRGYLQCGTIAMWTNGGFAYTPASMISACLKVDYPCGCEFHYEECINAGSNCDETLVSKLPLTAGSACNLGCPAGKRMIVAEGLHGWWYRVENMRCNGSSWAGKYWMYDSDATFSFANAYVTCEPSPFPIGFSWVINPMDCGWSTCQNERMYYDGSVIKCDVSRTLMVSYDKTIFYNSVTLTNLTWTGVLWNGYSLDTGANLAFPSSVFITCYYGTPPTPVPMTTIPTTTKTSTTVATTTTTVQYPCGCTYGIQPCSGGNCDDSLIQKVAPEDGDLCKLECPSGMRMIVADGLDGWYFRMDSLSCNGTTWSGLYWWSQLVFGYTLENAHVTCEYTGFPEGFDWPVAPIYCEYAICQTERLYYKPDVLYCGSGRVLTVSESQTSFVQPFALANLTWYAEESLWRGYDATTNDLHTFPSSIFITCYNGVPPTAGPTTTIPTTTTTTAGPPTTPPLPTGTCPCTFIWDPDCSGPDCSLGLVEFNDPDTNTCSLSCPAGWRLRVGKSPYYTRTDSFICDPSDTLWDAVYWHQPSSSSFVAGTRVSCENPGFPLDFDWPMDKLYVASMDMGKMFYVNDVIVCTAGSTLIASEGSFSLSNTRNFVNMSYAGGFWSGYLTSGELFEYRSASPYISCYTGSMPVPNPAPTAAPATTTPAAATTPAGATTTPCGCSYVKDPLCEGPDCTDVTASEQSGVCTISCADGWRMRSGDAPYYTRIDTVICQPATPNWSSKYWRENAWKTLADAVAVACEKTGFPIDYVWPPYLIADYTDIGRLFYVGDVIVCKENGTLTTSDQQNAFVNTRTFINISNVDGFWTGVLTSGETYVYTTAPYISCYMMSATPPNPATTAAPATTTPAAATTTTDPACAEFDELPAFEVEMECVDGQNRMVTEPGKRIEIHTMSETTVWDGMTYLAGHGWISFTFDGKVRLWTTTDADPIQAITAEGSM